MPMHIPADRLQAHLTANPLLLDVLKRLQDGGRSKIFQACSAEKIFDATALSCAVLLIGSVAYSMMTDSPFTRIECVHTQEVDDAAQAAAQEMGWFRDDGSIAMTDMYIVATARNCIKPQKEKYRLPEFMRKKLQEYRAFMNASDDGGAAQVSDPNQAGD